jgi:L-aspartate oxidase
MSKVIETDVLIIGSGFAGLLTAIKLLESGISVVLACKTYLTESSTNYAQGGIAATTDGGSFASVESHLEDTLKAGAGLVDEKVAAEIIASSWPLIQELKEYSVTFDYLADGSFSLTREGGHSTARVYHYQDITGKSISHGLIDKLKHLQASAKDKNQLQIYENKLAYSLVMSNGTCWGANFIDNETGKPSQIKDSNLTTILAKHTILATGGIGQVFSRTTNPFVATGDGIALAYNVGAQLIDMEFVQFHPTALHLKEDSDMPAFLISEAVRGAGAILLDSDHKPFMQRFHPAAELATRDIVSQAIYQIMQETHQRSVFLDLRPIGKETLKKKFPNIINKLKDYGIDAFLDLVPVSPAAHYFMGGIRAECNGRTSVPFLYAIGECASTGLHGANRLASNSLLEAGVMAMKIAQFITEQENNPGRKNPGKEIKSGRMSSITKPADLLMVKQTMSQEVGIIGSSETLQKALHLFEDSLITNTYSVENIQASNILLIAKLIAGSALRRQESRGSHCRSDYPNTAEQFACRQIVTRDSYSWTNPNDLKLSAKV